MLCTADMFRIFQDHFYYHCHNYRCLRVQPQILLNIYESSGWYSQQSEIGNRGDVKRFSARVRFWRLTWPCLLLFVPVDFMSVVISIFSTTSVQCVPPWKAMAVSLEVLGISWNHNNKTIDQDRPSPVNHHLTTLQRILVAKFRALIFPVDSLALEPSISFTR